MNYIDLIFAVILVLYMWRGYHQGFWVLFTRFISFVAGLIIALATYQWVGRIIVERIDIPLQYGYILSFIFLFIVIQSLFGSLFNKLLKYLPEIWHKHVINRILGIAPAFLDGVIFVTLLVLLTFLFPISPNIKNDVTRSRIGNYIINAVPSVEDYSRRIFGTSIEESLTRFAIKPNPDETVSIPFKPKTLSIDEESEVKMLELINAERAKVNAKPLVIDKTITEVARKHSRDMWQRQYFAHENPDGQSPFDRMSEGGVKYIAAGENLAFAPTLGVAHQGLMNSPGHKRNILDPNFGRVGIGVISGGIYGKMFTQNFAN